MNVRTRAFDVIEGGELQAYPISRSVRLPTHYFTAFWHHRWFNSVLHLTGSLEVQGAALNLFFLSQVQSPLGTLPDSDELLARMLRIDLMAWQDLRRRSVSPLHNWQYYDCEGERRWGHPVVIEVLEDAIERREVREASQEAQAVTKRLQRMRQVLAGMGLDKAVIGDDVLIGRLDQWLSQHWRGNRTQAAYDRVLSVASKEGWFRLTRNQ